MQNVATLILGGGKGTRLFPLTAVRSKPAVPLGGKYRLIDIPISNCLHSELKQIYLLTQFNSQSLHRHLRTTYKFDDFSGGFVEILAAEQTFEGTDWYQGTADAVRKQINVIKQRGVEYVLILSGDQLYRMDYRDLLKTHIDSGAEATIATLPVSEEDAKGFGIMRLDDTGRVVGFLEKPQTKDDLEIVRTDAAWIDNMGLRSNGREYLASMGIYLFNRDFLVESLEKTDYEDFGKEVFPAAIRSSHVQVHLFDGYWEDIGTIKAFFDANLQMAKPNPDFALYSDGEPTYTRARYLPPTRIDGGTVSGSLIADGCMIGQGSVIENSIIGLRSRIGKNVTIRNSIIMGGDITQTRAELREDLESGRPPIGIGDGSVIEGAIVDKNCRVGENVTVLRPSGVEADADGFEARDGDVLVRDGVVCIPKGTILPAGWSFESSTHPTTIHSDRQDA